MPTLNAYKTIEEQKKTKDSCRRRMRWRGEKFLQILDLEDLDTLPLPHLAHSLRAAQHGDVTACPCLASRQHEGGSQLVWRRAGAGGESEVEARRRDALEPTDADRLDTEEIEPTLTLEGRVGEALGGRWAKPSARWQMFCVCATMASSQAMGACTRDSVARPRCLPGRVVSWPPPPRLSRASRA
ncbi:hypothetical protein B0H14DRAFT_3008133 [Mycena olivaceomarginata]|nr:hypothetical protein B0H14DRAFT_3008133 [Mycena olivaceomarginata]